MMMIMVDIPSYCPLCYRNQKNGCGWIYRMAAVFDILEKFKFRFWSLEFFASRYKKSYLLSFIGIFLVFFPFLWFKQYLLVSKKAKMVSSFAAP
jgi:hypothetical protein